MKKQETDLILTQMLNSRKNISDLNFTVGRPPQVECDGVLHPVVLAPDLSALTPYQTEELALSIIGQNRRALRHLVEEGACDLSYTVPGKTRFRANIFSQSGGNYSIVLRKVDSTVPSIKTFGLPEIFYEIAGEKNGLIFVCGATGMGKSTSIAAMLDAVNETQPVHVITLEDPIEFQHTSKKATFNQRELGTDFSTFNKGLISSLRQSPKVIMMGEMRDYDSAEIGLRAAETGHLVLTTLHTIDAGRTINRILGFFEGEEKKQARIRLASTVRWIVCQRLLPTKAAEGGRIAAFEILGNSMRTEEIILNGESEGKTFYSVMQAGRHRGMCTFDDSILRLYSKGLIDENVALAYASQRGFVSRGIDRIKISRGETTSDITGLELDRSYRG
ncbi:PilT/PilU family type 4a pilus ATPase [Desulfococcaceae bacterium OttesenSCG-928-F15]|nr:PilT/PilU family type 4a pilus ATPase [Desulfococcaceae bacterium OttesenSCG-928-F15]